MRLPASAARVACGSKVLDSYFDMRIDQFPRLARKLIDMKSKVPLWRRQSEHSFNDC